MTRNEKRKVIERICARDKGKTVEWASAYLKHNREVYRGYLAWVFPVMTRVIE